MTDYPITPPENLVASMIEDAFGPLGPAGLSDKQRLAGAFSVLANRAAQWGADQELEACLAEVSFLNSRALADRIRAKRRPQTPSIKEQAHQALGRFYANAHTTGGEMTADFELLRRAVEQLSD